MRLEFSDGVIEISRKTISYFALLKNLFEDDEKAQIPIENISTKTFTSLLKWIHGEEVVIDDDIINLVIFFNMIEPHKTRFCTEIMDYLLAEPRLLPRVFYINLLKVDPGRLFLFAEKYFSDEEKAYFRTFMTRPENLGEDNEFNGKLIVYDNMLDHNTIDNFLASNSDAWVYICKDLPSLEHAKNIIVDLSTIPDIFYGSSNVVNVILLSTKKIGGWFLNRCESLIHLEIPESVTQIGHMFLYDCVSLTQINIPNSVSKVGDHFLSGCILLKQVNIPNSMTNIGNYFLSRTTITQIELPKSITIIRDWFLYGCTSLTHLEIPQLVTQIGYAFLYACNLKHLTIPLHLKDRVPSYITDITFI